MVERFDQHYAEISKADPTQEENIGKECSNLIVLLTELYNFNASIFITIY
jgi:hypothetical protein